jgi:predicted unusual protein kinase regulating ubiquinone biosynthesis (AarF/ABC1/UbiB family)
MPRRKSTHRVDTAQVILPTPRRTLYKPGIIRPIVRLLVWFWASVRFFVGSGIEMLIGRGSVERRAARLRSVLEQTGATFIKLGQQLSIRADLLPYAYCAELSRMLDQAPPVPGSQAIATIERSLGRPLAEIFSRFDPDPIGSASLACVYQATLKTGEHVAVKVLRPGIGLMLAADLRAMNWLLILAETFTFIRPGLTRDFREHFSTMLMDELNLRAEARFTEMFRLRAEKDGEGITAPRVFFEYCTDEVLVSELVSGIWMWELMAAIDRDDQEFLSYARSLGIEPGVVARRLVRVLHRELLEHLFFHADPHPANLVILPNSHICFIDFGSVGRFSTETRNTWREMQYHLKNGDVTRMVHASITLAGRLFPIDVERALKSMERLYADWLYAIKSTDAQWWERSSARTWLRYINMARHYGIPVSLEALHFFRATFLYDTIIVRLDNTVDPVREFKSYTLTVGKEAKRRLRRQARKRLYGPTDLDYIGFESLADLGTQLFFRIQRGIEDPIIHFRNIVGKIAYTLSTLLRFAYLALTLVGLGLIAHVTVENWVGRPIPWSEILDAVATSRTIQIMLIVILLVVIRRLLARMNEPDQVPDTLR